ncbi:hypothetical protein MBLNU230_g5036t1 [Neophaeotheca triangularis]
MRRKFHALKRPKTRQDWNKYNFYNLSRMATPFAAVKTYFQQKWLAKSLSRAYHGPHIREGIWTRMFDRRLPAVVPMDHRYLAEKDGSEHAGGRGLGWDRMLKRDELKKKEKIPEKTPYMQMAYHPMERRLDMAIWRALFASSTKQARQFVVHGWVKVNGKKMIYPGYQLNPGDMFSVEPERVLFATGAKKAKANSPDADVIDDSGADTGASRRQPMNERDPDAAEEEGALEEPDSDAGAATLESEEDRTAMTSKPEQETDPKKALKTLVTRAKKILGESKRQLSGRRQQELREFTRSVKKTLSKHGQKGTGEGVEGLETALAAIINKIPTDDVPKPELGSAEAAEAADAAANNPDQNSSNPQAGKSDAYVARRDAQILSRALARAAENPIDSSKPYATPWRPRDYMSAFAFIPRYLEVNQNICSAVYLRHPVARPGLAEVPTPFSGETMGLAFNWYLRRR